MKNVVCPVSSERVSENIPRLVGLFVVILLIVYVIFEWWIIPAFLVLDFYFRGFEKGKYSLLAKLANLLNSNLSNKGKLINKAPKIFAARLGFVFTLLTLVFSFLDLQFVSTSLAAMLIVFASLECVANFCVGCLVFTWFVQPYSRA